MKSLDSAILAELAKINYKTVYLCRSSWGSGELYITNHTHEITHNNNLYVPLGGLFGVSDIKETLQLSVNSGSVSIVGLPQSIRALTIYEEFIGRTIEIYIAFINELDAVIDEPILVQKGIMNDLTCSDEFESGTVSVSVNYTSHMQRYDDVNGRRSNPSEHKNKYPNDTFFDSVPSLAEKVLEW